MSQYVPEKYITVDDALEHLGFTKVQINDLDETTRNRYRDWVRQANGKVETFLSNVGGDTIAPLPINSKEYVYAKSAALHWVVYKKRDKEGSRNAINAKNDYKDDLEEIAKFLTSTRSDRTETVSILGKSPTRVGARILLPSQIDTAFYD